MLLELVIFAFVLVGLQTLVGIFTFKYVMSEKFLKNYVKKSIAVAKVFTEEMENEEES